MFDLLTGYCSRGGEQSGACLEGRVRCHQWIAISTTAPLPPNSEYHLRGEKLYNHIPSTHRLPFAIHAWKTQLNRRPYLVQFLRTCHTWANSTQWLFNTVTYFLGLFLAQECVNGNLRTGVYSNLTVSSIISYIWLCLMALPLAKYCQISLLQHLCFGMCSMCKEKSGVVVSLNLRVNPYNELVLSELNINTCNDDHGL